MSHHLHLLVPPVEQAGFYSHKTAQGIVRTYVLPLKDYQIQVSQQERVREAFAWELAGSMFIPYLIILPFAIFALAAIIRRGLKPIDDFKNELKERDSEELTPIEVHDYPQELLPTIDEMNRLLSEFLKLKMNRSNLLPMLLMNYEHL